MSRLLMGWIDWGFGVVSVSLVVGFGGAWLFISVVLARWAGSYITN